MRLCVGTWKWKITIKILLMIMIKKKIDKNKWISELLQKEIIVLMENSEKDKMQNSEKDSDKVV